MKTKSEFEIETLEVIKLEEDFIDMSLKMEEAKNNGEFDLVYEKKLMRPTYESVLKYYGYKVEELDSALIIISWDISEN